MRNAIKGEGVEIEIGGKLYPLIFDMEAIAEVETKHDLTILEVQGKLPRVAVMADLLNAALVGYDGDLSKDKLPPLIETQMLIQKALTIAYYGNEPVEKVTKAATKKNVKS